MENEIISGQLSTWSLLKKLGEGDAGEVYLVESLVGRRSGVLKRPQKSAFTGDIVRQSAQIKAEGIILKTLAGFNAPGANGVVKVPELLDQSKPGTDFSDRLFIIIAKARGFDLSFLERTCRMDLPGQNTSTSGLNTEEVIFLRSIAENGRVPDRILITCLVCLLETLEAVHCKPVDLSSGAAEGIIYNDIKPEHIFWDPQRGSVTLIDWGNAQFVEQGGMSRDRQYSTKHDFRQFVEEMGKYLASGAPALRSRLDWPAYFNFEDDLLGPGGLRDRIKEAAQIEADRLVNARSQQEALLQPENSGEDALALLEAVQKELLALGDIPDYRSAARFAGGYATRLVMNGDVDLLQQVCSWAANLPGDQGEQWRLVARLAQIAARAQGDLRKNFLDAIQAAICADWETVLWTLVQAIGDAAEPNWWYEVIGQIRRLQLGSGADTLLPLVAANRLALGLQMAIRQIEDSLSRRAVSSAEMAELSHLKLISRTLQEDVVSSWTLVDPHPPQAALDYDYLSRVLKDLGKTLQGEQQVIGRILNQPRSQVQLTLDAWNRKDFVSASQGLRHILMWDPDRRRVILADRLIFSAPEWLQKAHLGPLPGEAFHEFATDLEFEGRELRNHVGPAGWLDEILECLGSLRKGVWPADLLAGRPKVARELPWLKKFERLERLPAEVKALEGEPAASSTPSFKEISGLREGTFGPEGELRVIEPLDAWAPEARGSSARVYLAEQSGEKGQSRQVALKLMRMDKADYAIPLFREEVQILALMDKVPGVNRMLECGFILMDGNHSLPLDSDIQAVRALKGALFQIGPEAGQNFLDQIEARVDEGWTPYLIIEKQEKENNLLLLCDSGLTHGRYLPVVNLIQMAVQICDILEAAHSRRIVYRDHKILHYYWQERTNGIYLIDWNVARLYPNGLTEEERQMDLVQFGARGLHYILTGRAAPGALPLGPTRPDEIEQAAQSYRTQWTYDDERLSPGLREIIEAVLAGKYSQPALLRDDLKGIYMHG